MRAGQLRLPRVIVDPYKEIKVMNLEMDVNDIRREIKKLKNRKASGTDGMKAEMFKAVESSEIVMEAL